MPLPGSDKYRVAKEQRDKPKTDYERANEAQDVLPLLLALGCNIPSEVERSWKFHCPFGAEHSDGGVDKAARYYGMTGTAYCFAGHEGLTAVKLVAYADGISYTQAAEKILTEKGLVAKPLSYQEKFALIATGHEPAPLDTSYAITALRQWCTLKFPKYPYRQYDADVRNAFILCVDALNGMDDPDVETVRQWLAKAKQVMEKVLGDGTD